MRKRKSKEDVGVRRTGKEKGETSDMERSSGPNYEPGSGFFTLNIHYGGYFEGGQQLTYKGGKVEYLYYTHMDYISMLSISKLLLEIGLYGFTIYWFKEPGKSLSEKVAIENDKDLLWMCSFGETHRQLDLYVEEITEEQAVEREEEFVKECLGLKSTVKITEVDPPPLLALPAPPISAASPPERVATTPQRAATPPQRVAPSEVSPTERAVSPPVHDDLSPTLGENAQPSAHDDQVDDLEMEIEEENVYYERDDEELFGQEDLHEEPFGQTEFGHDMFDGGSCEETPRASGIGREGEAVDFETETPRASEVNLDDLGVQVEDEVESDYAPSDQLLTPEREDDMEGRYGEGPQDDSNPFRVGQEYASIEKLKYCIKTHAIVSGRGIKFEKSDRKRVKAVCVGNCPWLLYGAVDGKTNSVFIRTLYSEHTCERSMDNKFCTAEFLANHYLERIKNDPRWPTTAMVGDIQRELHVRNITQSKCFRTKEIAFKIINGTYLGQYQQLYNYAAELYRSNPDSTVIIKATPSDSEGGRKKFQRMYVCLGALKQGFKQGCRKWVGLDGSFLKTRYGGIIVSAVGVDPNDQMYPIAFGVVESENSDSWTWFVRLLAADLEIEDQSLWTFMSDKQKGLAKAFEDVLPAVEVRHCVRHLYSNMKDTYKGKQLKDLLWEAAEATTVPAWKAVMQKIKDVDPGAYDWLMDRPANHWTKSHFRKITVCDKNTNNLNEAFNKYILTAREKPIVTLMETIRKMLMQRMVLKRQWIKSLPGKICPKIKKKLRILKDQSWQCTPYYSGNLLFEVHVSVEEHFIVDLGKKQCSCNAWELSGIPCIHAVSAILWCRKDPEDYVDECYSIESLKKAYAPIIHPINGQQMWPESEVEPIDPPMDMKPRPGRPKKARNKSNDEPVSSQHKMKRSGTVTCAICSGKGHNKRSCDPRKRAEAAGIQQKEKGRPGRPRKHPRPNESATPLPTKRARKEHATQPTPRRSASAGLQADGMDNSTHTDGGSRTPSVANVFARIRQSLDVQSTDVAPEQAQPRRSVRRTRQEKAPSQRRPWVP